MEKYELKFEADDINDEGWDIILDTLKKNLNGFKVLYGNGDNVTLMFHSHKYEVWASWYKQGNIYQEDCILLTDDLEEAKKIARKEKIIRDRENNKFDTSVVEIRTDFDDSTGSYNTVDFANM